LVPPQKLGAISGVLHTEEPGENDISLRFSKPEPKDGNAPGRERRSPGNLAPVLEELDILSPEGPEARMTATAGPTKSTGFD